MDVRRSGASPAPECLVGVDQSSCVRHCVLIKGVRSYEPHSGRNRGGRSTISLGAARSRPFERQAPQPPVTLGIERVGVVTMVTLAVRSGSLVFGRRQRITLLKHTFSERARTGANAAHTCHAEGRGLESLHPLSRKPPLREPRGNRMATITSPRCRRWRDGHRAPSGPPVSVNSGRSRSDRTH